MIGPHAFLRKEEVFQVLDYLQCRPLTDLHSRLNLSIFRLSACCGLRTCEIKGLQLRDLNFNETFPCITVRGELGATKGKNGHYRSRVVPLNWDRGTYEDLLEWYEYRVQNTRDIRKEKLRGEQPYICGVTIYNWGKTIHVNQIAKKWKTAMKYALGPERAKQLSIHRGRDTFASWAIAMGRSVKEVQIALGHASLSSTDVYTHAVDSLRPRPDIFAAP